MWWVVFSSFVVGRWRERLEFGQPGGGAENEVGEPPHAKAAKLWIFLNFDFQRIYRIGFFKMRHKFKAKNFGAKIAKL